MFVVLDTGKPASIEGYPDTLHPSWKTNKFNSFEEAQKYAQKYFYPYLGERDWDCPLELNKPIVYEDRCIAEIREVP